MGTRTMATYKFTADEAFEARDEILNAKPGQVLVLSNSGRVIRIEDALTNWAATAYQVQADRSLKKVA